MIRSRPANPSDMLRAMIRGQADIDLPMARRLSLRLASRLPDPQKSGELQAALVAELESIRRAMATGSSTDRERYDALSALIRVETAARQ